MTTSTECWMLAHRSCIARTNCDCACHHSHLTDLASATPPRSRPGTPARPALARGGIGEAGPTPREAASGGLRLTGVNGAIRTPSPKARPARPLPNNHNGSSPAAAPTACRAA